MLERAWGLWPASSVGSWVFLAGWDPRRRDTDWYELNSLGILLRKGDISRSGPCQYVLRSFYKTATYIADTVVVRMTKEKKIGTQEILKVSRHGSGHYLRLPKPTVDAFGLQKGDLLRIRIDTLIREDQD